MQLINELLKMTGVVALLLTALVFPFRVFLQAWIDGRVRQRLSFELEDHRSQLQRQVEELRFLHQQELRHHGLFADRQFEVTGELYRLVRVADGVVQGLLGFRHMTDWPNLSPADADEIMEIHEFPRGLRQNLVDSWDNDRARSAKLATEHARKIELEKARHRIQEARNYLWLNEPFFDERVVEATEEVAKVLHEHMVDIEYSPEDAAASRKELQQRVEKLRATFKEVFREKRAVQADKRHAEIPATDADRESAMLPSGEDE